MVIRHVSRNRLRSFVTVTAVSLATSIAVLAYFAFSAWDEIVDAQYRLVERQDAVVSFHRKQSLSALYEVRRLVGVMEAEPELLVSVKLVHGRKSHTTALRGLQLDGRLHALLDADLRHARIPADGIVLAQALATVLDIEAGESLRVQVKEGREPVLDLPVVAVVDEFLGANAYCDIGTLSRWIGEEQSLSSVRIRVDPERERELGRVLKDLPGVSAVSFKNDTVTSLRKTVQGSQQIMNVVVLGFAGIIAFGVLYNTARISLAQRGRELASLRILGYSHREVGAVLAGEGLLLTTIGLLPGLGLGTLMSAALAKANQNELYTFPFVMPASNLISSAGVILLFSILANTLVLIRLRRSDVIEVLKTRE